MTLAELKTTAQKSFTAPLAWTDHAAFGGSAWASIGKQFVSVMVAPPEGNPTICLIQGRKQLPLPAVETMDIDWTQLPLALR